MGSKKEIFLQRTGKAIPLVGFGTAEYPFGASSEKMKDYIVEAIKLGYRHFDSASLYQSEQHLGEAISEALQLGLIKSRDELFVTSKLWCSDAHHDLVIPAIRTSLKNLKLEYLDLCLIHWPVSVKPGEYRLDIKKEDLVPFDFNSVWKAMEECQMLGLTKGIGVSNYSCKKLEALVANAKIRPVVNQVEMNPLWQQKQLREFCGKNGIHITAYSPLGAQGTAWGTNHVMKCEVLKEIADRIGKSVAQVCLRWIYEQGVSVLVKSFKEERMRENIEIFDWQLNRHDLEMISQIPQQKGFQGLEFISVDGQYKSLTELWDGEI